MSEANMDNPTASQADEVFRAGVRARRILKEDDGMAGHFITDFASTDQEQLTNDNDKGE